MCVVVRWRGCVCSGEMEGCVCVVVRWRGVCSGEMEGGVCSGEMEGGVCSGEMEGVCRDVHVSI